MIRSHYPTIFLFSTCSRPLSLQITPPSFWVSLLSLSDYLVPAIMDPSVSLDSLNADFERELCLSQTPQGNTEPGTYRWVPPPLSPPCTSPIGDDDSSDEESEFHQCVPPPLVTPCTAPTDDEPSKDFGSPEKNSIYQKYRSLVADMVSRYDSNWNGIRWTQKEDEIIALLETNSWMINETAFKLNDDDISIIELSFYYVLISFAKRLLALGAKPNEEILCIVRDMVSSMIRQGNMSLETVGYIAILYLFENGPDSINFKHVHPNGIWIHYQQI